MLCSTALADEEREITVKYAGTKIEFDVAPRLINDRTFVPLRAIFEAMNATVDYDDDTSTITAYKSGITIKMQIGVPSIHKEQQAIVRVGDGYALEDEYVISDTPLDVAPVIIDDRTLVPVRAISESFDCIIDWNAQTYTVNITSQPEL